MGSSGNSVFVMENFFTQCIGETQTRHFTGTQALLLLVFKFLCVSLLILPVGWSS